MWFMCVMLKNNHGSYGHGLCRHCYSISSVSSTVAYFFIERKQGTTLRAFLDGKDVSTLLLTDLGKSLITIWLHWSCGLFARNRR